MRRILSILLLLVLGLGPAAEALPADGLISGLIAGWTAQPDESRLPICCRHNGKHHCDMPTQAQIAQFAADAGQPIVAANETCPFWPTALAPVPPSVAALARATSIASPFSSENQIPPAAASVVATRQLRSQPKRGPPTPSFL